MAEPIGEPHHPWKDWAQERAARRRVEANLAPSKGLANVDPVLIQPALDAIDPTSSPFDFLATGVTIGTRGFIRYFASKVITKSAFEIALKGGAHNRFLKEYRNVSNKELKKGIKSFDKKINRHLKKMKTPEREYPNFKNLDPRHQQDLLHKKWPSDVKRLREQKEILRRILNERN